MKAGGMTGMIERLPTRAKPEFKLQDCQKQDKTKITL
jgi:hypothetical protein